MNKHNGKLINVIATGFVVLVLFSLVLFWGRLFCYGRLMAIMPWEYKMVTISPSGLVPGEGLPRQQRPARGDTEAGVSNEPNIRLSAVYADMKGESAIFEAIDIGINRRLSEARRLPFRAKGGIYYWYQDKSNYLYFHERSGLLACNRTRKTLALKSVAERSEFFAGPNGVSETASASIGRFEGPIVSAGFSMDRVELYDGRQRRFYLVDFANGTVTKGLELAAGDSREPIAMGLITKGIPGMGLVWVPPGVKDANGDWEHQKLFLPDDAEPNEGRDYWVFFDRTREHIPVLDKSGRIYNYDTKEQSLVQVGYLPMPQSLYATHGHNEVANPGDVLGYNIQPVYAVRRSPGEGKKAGRVIDVKYLGMCVGSVSREGTAMTLTVFDPNGKLVYRGDTEASKDGVSTAEAVYSNSPLATTILFLLENLQPVVFEVASYLCADCFEAGAGHRALFILPNSFVGMIGRRASEILFRKPMQALLLMGPSLILSVWLGLKVKKDAKLVGLSNAAGKWWTAGTIAFGLPAYITYRLTRHKEVLVTCQNCGMLRRPDMEKCHRCGSKWEMPELTPPNWRICN